MMKPTGQKVWFAARALGMGLAAVVAFAMPASAGAVRALAGLTTDLGRNDDGSSAAVSLGFSANFFGTTYTSIFVNNNGNVTFSGPMSGYTPFGLTGPLANPILAPFFADVDTRGLASGTVHYGTDTLGGHNVFGVNWPSVGYYPSATNKLNDFQLIITDRSDTGAGNFDFEFNYNQIQWETGGASGGSNGLGGTAAAAGYSNGSGTPGTNYQFPGSLAPGSLIDGGPDALITHSLNSGVDGRYDFSVRNGVVSPIGTPEPATFAAAALGVVFMGVVARRRRLA